MEIGIGIGFGFGIGIEIEIGTEFAIGREPIQEKTILTPCSASLYRANNSVSLVNCVIGTGLWHAPTRATLFRQPRASRWPFKCGGGCNKRRRDVTVGARSILNGHPDMFA